MSADINTGQPKTGNSKRNKKNIVLVGGIVLVFVIGITLSMVFGVFYAGVKTPKQRVTVQTIVCNDDGVLKKLNGYLTEIADTGDKAKAREAISYVTSQANYTADATCVEALARLYYINRDPDNFSKQINALEKFAKNGIYPSNQFNGLTSLQSKNLDYENLTGEAR